MVRSAPSLRMRQNAPVYSKKEKKEAHRKNVQQQPKYKKTNEFCQCIGYVYILQEKRTGY